MPLYNTRFIKTLEADEKLRSVAIRNASQGFPLSGIVAPLADTIANSAVYKNYLKKDRNEPGADALIWKEIFNAFIAQSPLLEKAAASYENYSPRGVERMRELAFQTFTNFFASQGHLSDALKNLDASLDKARELYLRLMWLPVELTRLREVQIGENSKKYLPSDEDRNPNLRFVENQLVEKISEIKELSSQIESKKLSLMAEDPQILERILKAIMESDIYKEYMEFPATDFAMDCNLWRNLLKQVVFVNIDFLEMLEDKSVFWNDDLDSIGTFVLKTLKRVEDGASQNTLLEMYKDEEDSRFGKELFTAAVRNADTVKSYIDEALNKKTWEMERLAFMDVVIIITAIAEILTFPKIPTSVSVNEYIEIAKAYSTSKSGAFVHGLLGAITSRLREEGKLLKE